MTGRRWAARERGVHSQHEHRQHATFRMPGDRTAHHQQTNCRNQYLKKPHHMNTLTRWEPIQELEELQNRLTNLFGRGGLRRANGGEEALTVAEWAPLVDIIEDDKEYIIKAEIPGVTKENVKVAVENGVLTISGERKLEKEEKNKKYHRVERAYGFFARSFTLPDVADAEHVQAEFKDGELKVHLPKSEKAKPKQIEVKVA
jgi:HSP20 family protein